MKTRVIVGALGAVLVVLALYVFPPLVMELLVCALCVLATYEITRATKLVGNKLMFGLTLLASLTTALVHTGVIREFGLTEEILRWLVFVFTICAFGTLLRFYESMKFSEVAYGYVGGFVIPYLLMSLVRIFQMENGKFLILLPLLAAWGADTCAYFTGVFWGRHKLAPVVSPKKTVEGAVGGIVGGALLVSIASFALNATVQAEIPIAAMICIGVAGAMLGEIGDLSFSIVKRQCNVKDYGNLLPGHGGVLDRFDSVIFVAPFVELIFRIIW